MLISFEKFVYIKNKSYFYKKFVEGVGDKFLKTKYPNYIDEFDNFEKEYLKTNRKNMEIVYQDKNWQIIKNPKSLENFGSKCRGVILENGDLYLESHSNSSIHNDILKILYSKNIIEGTFKKNWGKKTPQESGFLTVQRYKDTNIIAIGESNKDIYDELDWKNRILDYDIVLEKAKKKNPKINFSNKLVGVKFQGLKKLTTTLKEQINIF